MDHNRRRAFSLVELMIAIIILGIGLTMVATLFPIALQQTEKAVEVSMAPAVADYAESILKLKLKTWSDWNKNRTNKGNANYGQVDTTMAASQAAAEAPVTLAEREQSDWPNDPWDNDPFRVFFPIPCENLLRLPGSNANDTLARYLTPGTNLIKTENRFDFPNADTEQEIAWFGALAWQDILGANPPLPQLPPPASLPQPSFVRTKITVFDRVYPPPEFRRSDGTTMYGPPNLALLTGPAADPAVITQYMDDTGRRRYAWKAFARRLNTPAPSDGTNSSTLNVGERDFRLAIFVLERAAANQKFAAQAYPPTAPYPPLVASFYDYTLLYDPFVAAPIASAPTIFPQPWLVAFTKADYQSGEIFCFNPPTTARLGVAAMLPPGSLFIDFATGSPHRVISRSFGDDAAGATDIIRLAPDPSSPARDPDRFGPGVPGPVAGAEMAWIFPPAYDFTRQTFEDESPVVDVFLRDITVK